MYNTKGGSGGQSPPEKIEYWNQIPFGQGQSWKKSKVIMTLKNLFRNADAFLQIVCQANILCLKELIPDEFK